MSCIEYKRDEHWKELDRPWWPVSIFYRHYEVLRPMEFQTSVIGCYGEIRRKSDGRMLAVLFEDGRLEVYAGYYWDGPSGPTIDTYAFIMASLPHDVLYQMLREEVIINRRHYATLQSMDNRFKKLRKWSDDTMRTLNLAYGMCEFRADYTYKSVRWFGRKHALPASLKLK